MRICIIMMLAVVTLLCWREIHLLPDGKLHIYMLNVGQGDSFFVVTPSGAQILIDGGPDLSTLSHLGSLMPFFDRSIDMVVLTHPDKDHITALPSVLKRYDIKTVLLGGVEHTSGTYEQLLSDIVSQQTTVMLPDPSKDIAFDDVTLDVVWPPIDTIATHPSSQNNASIVLRLLYGSHAILFTGDIEQRAEQEILASGADISADIMTVPHHGSRTSSSTGFLLAVSPNLALVSAGTENRYGHPHAEIVDRYTKHGIALKTTPEYGTVFITCDLDYC